MKKIIRVIFKVLIGAFLFLVALGMIASNGSESSSDTKPAIVRVADPLPPEEIRAPELLKPLPSPAAVAKSEEPVIVVTASTLYEAYDANPIEADANYRYKQATVVGMVIDIGREILGDPYVVLDGDAGNVNCYFPKANEPQVVKVRKGQKVAIKGEVRGLVLGGVMLNQSRLLEQAQPEKVRVARAVEQQPSKIVAK
jgi:hypothetical protein